MTLLDAVKARDAAQVRAILASDPGAAARERTPEGLRPLHLALYLRQQAIVDALLAASEPSVWEAAILGDITRLRKAAADERASLLAPGPDGFTPLHLAAHFGQLDALRLLLRLDVPASLVGGGALANTPLHAALAGGQRACARALLQAGASVGARDGLGNTPLHVAAANDLDDIILDLVARGAEAGARNRDGKTPLDVARERDASAAARALAGERATPDERQRRKSG